MSEIKKTQRRAELLKKANELPLSPGVYVMKNQSGRVIYVGKSRKLKNRVSQYFQNSIKNIKTERMVSLVYDFDYYLCSTEIEALSLENTLIKQHSPRYNIRLKDSKSYPYIKVTQEEYPRILFTRKRENDKAKYFGPYTGTATVFSIMNLLQKSLGIPSCNRKFPRDIGKERPCVYYQMNQCCGVCAGKVSSYEYNDLVKCACDILRGNTAKAKKLLEEQMYKYADKEFFEAAASCRDTIEALDKIKQRQHVVAAPEVEEDIIALYQDDFCSVMSILYIREGVLNSKLEFVFGGDSIVDNSAIISFICDNYKFSEYIPQNIYISFNMDVEDRELLECYLGQISGRRVYVKTPERGDAKNLCELALSNAKEKAREYSSKFTLNGEILVRLASLLSLEIVPERIEAYDISNIGAEFKTAGMIVCENGEFIKSDYRSFRIKSVSGIDDYASMSEAISRRFEHLNDETGAFSKLPDLILLDGGRGHVAVIREMMAKKGLGNIAVFGMVKDDHHNTRAICDDNFEYEISCDRGIFTYIYKIQEEVHRYTVSKMQKAKRKTVRRSTLENISGIGPEKAKILLSAFGSVAGVKSADFDTLCSVKGISESNAMQIIKYYSEDETVYDENNRRQSERDKT